MATLNETKFNALTALGHTSGTLNNREYAWLAAQTGFASGKTLNEQWFILLGTLGFTSGNLNERQMASWLDAGHTGNWNERAKKFWEAGGVY